MYRTQAIISFFQGCIENEEPEVVKKGYVAATHFEISTIRRPKLLTEHLGEEFLHPFVLGFLTVVDVEHLESTLIEKLFQMPEEKLVPAILWRFARSPKYAVKIIHKLGSSLMPPPGELMKLLLVLIEGRENPQILSKLRNLPELLLSILNKADTNLLTPLTVLIRRLPINVDFVLRLDEVGFISGFIDQIQTYSLTDYRFETFRCACFLFDRLLRVTWFPSFLAFLPIAVRRFAHEPRLQKQGMSLLTTASLYSMNHETMKKLGIPEILSEAAVNSFYRDLVENTKHNMSVP
jgi:hypothetical protein